jgi:hypothetical protein
MNKATPQKIYKKFCSKGHEMIGKNILLSSDGTRRRCRTCKNIARKRYRDKHRVMPLNKATFSKLFCSNGHRKTSETLYITSTGQRRCKTCSSEQTLRYKKKHSSNNTGYVRKHYLKRKYGVNPEDVLNHCEICGGDNGKKAMCVDHDHETGAVRGTLCSSCNTGIGMLKDNIEILTKAISYLVKSNVQSQKNIF